MNDLDKLMSDDEGDKSPAVKKLMTPPTPTPTSPKSLAEEPV